MDLWIRSQDKESLIQVDCLCIEKNEIDKGEYIYSSFDIVQGCITLGTYKTKERALKVLDEIQNILKPIIRYEPITREKIDYTKPYVQTEQIGSKSVIQELSTYVYEMPKE